MKHILMVRSAILAMAFCFLVQLSTANNAVYEQRRESYIDSMLLRPSGAKIILQAYRQVPVDTVQLDLVLSEIASGVTSDFDIIELVRILFFSNGAYDARILPVLYNVPFWLNYGDTIRNYWSENHMIMWMSSDWLLHERYGKPIDSRLEARLRHYLQLKVQYGFYEFFSSVYAPYELSGLLNLADFSQDVQIKNLATQAAQLLLTEMLMLTNDKGVFYPSAGRNYPGKYLTPYGQNHNNLIYLLTGLGEAPGAASAGGAFLATSTLPVDSIIASRTPSLNTLYNIGHSLDSGRIINSNMSLADRIVFQWSSGAYFHPDVVQETTQQLVDSNLWNQVDFSLLRPLSTVSPQDFPALANSLSSISKSSVICGQQLAIFKHYSVTLSSIQDFWKGKVGFQQYPCVANVGTTAVYTGSGEVKRNWNDRNPNTQNTHLPYVKQKGNLALLMYRPEPTASILGNDFNFKEVALHFRDDDFDEVVNDSMWLLGRQDESYVAVRRSCIGVIDSVRACPTYGGQTWVIMVGDSSMYGSFAGFQQVVNQSQFEESWYYDTLTAQSVYYAKVVVDTTAIDYAWGVDSLTTGIRGTEDDHTTFSIVPNPANQTVQIDLTGLKGDKMVEIYTAQGERVYQFSGSDASLSVATGHFSEGVYLVSIYTSSGHRATQRMVVIH